MFIDSRRSAFDESINVFQRKTSTNSPNFGEFDIFCRMKGDEARSDMCGGGETPREAAGAAGGAGDVSAPVVVAVGRNADICVEV